MKLENLTDLAAALRSIDDTEDSDLGFDMCSTFYNRFNTEHNCGSACCIGGWVHFLNPETRDLSIVNAVRTLAPSTDYRELFELCWFNRYEAAVIATPEQAARAVEILRDTGKCNWKRAMS